MKIKIIASALLLTLSIGLVGCADVLGEEAAQAVEEAQQKVMEAVKTEINEKMQEILAEYDVEGAEDFNLDDVDFEELEESTGLDFSALENIDKLELEELQELLEQLKELGKAGLEGLESLEQLEGLEGLSTEAQ